MWDPWNMPAFRAAGVSLGPKVVDPGQMATSQKLSQPLAPGPGGSTQTAEGGQHPAL